MLHTESFLDFEIKLIEQIFGKKFTGTTHKEKNDFYKKFEEELRKELDRTMQVLHVAKKARAFNFTAEYIDEVIIAEQRQDALDLFAETLLVHRLDIPEDIQIDEMNTELDTVLVEKNMIPETDLHLFETEDGIFYKVYVIYAISYALDLREDLTLPFFL